MVGWVITVLLHGLLVGSVVLCARPHEVMLQECAVQRLFIGASEELARLILQLESKLLAFVQALRIKRF